MPTIDWDGRHHLLLTLVVSLTFIAALAVVCVEGRDQGQVPQTIGGNHALSHYTGKLFKIGALGAFTIGCGWLAMLALRSRYLKHILPSVQPSSLNLVRIAVCTTVLTAVGLEDISSLALLPEGAIRPTGVMQLLHVLPGDVYGWFRHSHNLAMFKCVTMAIVILAMLRFLLRWTLPLSALCFLIFGGLLREYSHAFHSGLIPLYLLVILSISVNIRSSAMPESDRLAAKATYTACWLALALPYTAAALSKLRTGGFFWWTGENIRGYLVVDNLNPMHFSNHIGLTLAQAPAIVLSILGLSAIVLELSFVVVVFSVTARRVLPLFGALLHVGIWLLQNVLFLDAIILQLAFLAIAWLSEGQTAGQDSSLQNEFAPSSSDRKMWAIPALVIALFAGAWIGEVEAYPLSAWPMYAEKSNAERYQYYKVVGHFTDGQSSSLSLHHCIPALADGRSRDIIWMAFSEPHRRVCDTFLDSCIVSYNRGLSVGSSSLVAIEIQLWLCTAEEAVSPPPQGHLNRSYRFESRQHISSPTVSTAGMN